MSKADDDPAGVSRERCVAAITYVRDAVGTGLAYGEEPSVARECAPTVSRRRRPTMTATVLPLVRPAGSAAGAASSAESRSITPLPPARRTGGASGSGAARRGESLPAGVRLPSGDGNHYQIVREVGRGAAGTVYLARDVALHRTVALKVLPAPRHADADSAERFRREARMAAQLSHPNIVPLYAFGESAELLYIVMPFVDGGSLADRMNGEPRLPAAEVRRILADLALALDHAHRRGVVHRDVKPENVLLDAESGRAMLVDFGVATRRWWDVAPGDARRAFGTPAFMAPEQALGEPNVDGRSDVYAIGVLGYAMLSGQVPFAGDPVTITARQLRGEARPLAAAAPDAPAALVETIERCLAADAEARWPSARALHDALTRERPARPALAAWAERLAARLRRHLRRFAR